MPTASKPQCSRMTSHIYIFGLLLLWFSTSVLGQPILTLNAFNDVPSSYVRHSGSQGGLVNQVDQFIVTGTVNRNGETADTFTDDTIYFQLSATPANDNSWLSETNCRPDLSNCAIGQRGCYCSSAPADPLNGDFGIVFAVNASHQYKGIANGMMMTWIDQENVLSLALSNQLNYIDKTICDDITVTYNLGSGAQSLSNRNSEDISVPFPSNPGTLEFCVNGLVVADTTFVKIDKIEQATTELVRNTQNCVTGDISGTTKETNFSMSFQESSTTGCGRAFSYVLSFTASVSSTANSDLGCNGGCIAGITVSVVAVIGVITIMTL